MFFYAVAMCTHMHMQVFKHEMKHLALTIKPCPPGHAMMTTDSKDEYECKCNTDDQNIVDCLSNESKIILEVSWPLLLSHDQCIWILLHL